MKRLIRFFFPGVLLGFLLFFSLDHTACDPQAYHRFQVRHDIPRATGRSQAELDQTSRDLIAYLQHGEEDRLTPHFGEREVAHMADVYALFVLARRVEWVLGILLLLFLAAAVRSGEAFSLRSFVRDALVWAVALLLFVVLALTAFSDAFIAFHHLFFSNDLWILNPKTDYMIQMMPEVFFQGMALQIFIKTLLGYGLAVGSTALGLRWVRRRSKAANRDE